MAIARCEFCGCPKGANVKAPGYAPTPYRPVGYPETAIVCGKPLCDRSALVWLKRDEATRYGAGERVFSIHTQTAKVRLI